MTASEARIGFVSLGCPKALVDSERVLTQLRAEGYAIAPTYEDAELVVVNTCGFIEAAIEESFSAIEEALAENGRVIVTGCLGTQADAIRARFPEVLAITGPGRYEEVVGAVHRALPPRRDPFLDLLPPEGVKLTPRHYAYLKISEGCDHRCSFCIIPALRGRLTSRPIGEVLGEAERLVAAGVQELLVIAQDTSAYGVDLRHRTDTWRGRTWRSHICDLARALSELGVWVRLHYVYPYPHVDELIPLMAEGKLLPYLDIPFQHGSPAILKRMRRPATAEDTLKRIAAWRALCPEMALRSTFIVGFPGETEADFEQLLEFLEAARLDRVGCFQYSPVDGAKANELPDPVAPDIKEARYHRLMQTQLGISRARLRARIGRRLEVLVDEVTGGRATGRSYADAPEIDGKVCVRDAQGLRAGQRCRVLIEEAGDYDLAGRRIAS